MTIKGTAGDRPVREAAGGRAVGTVGGADKITGPQPRALIVTVYGLYARQAAGWMSVASIIELLGCSGVDEPSVRSAIFRLKRRGLLLADRRDGLAGYALSDEALAILDEGDRRIFTRPRAAVTDGWLLAVFSVPEPQRDKRHQLRSRLTWLGFGTVAAGTWIAPAHLLDEARAVLRRYGLDHYVELFSVRHVAFSNTAELVARCWDLRRLQQLYQTFLDHYESVLAGYRRRRRIDNAQAFADYLRALTEWRRLPFLDPGLPAAALPLQWNGIRAADTFFELRERLAAPADDFVSAVRSRSGPDPARLR